MPDTDVAPEGKPNKKKKLKKVQGSKPQQKPIKMRTSATRRR